mmetsp:Transcript_7473/g.23907  ORF Transcript_7473/g.23907 Transcript_7473/m.23907 type:complete len:228 (+) Transcript_7473:131-814(+)
MRPVKNSERNAQGFVVDRTVACSGERRHRRRLHEVCWPPEKFSVQLRGNCARRAPTNHDDQTPLERTLNHTATRVQQPQRVSANKLALGVELAERRLEVTPSHGHVIRLERTDSEAGVLERILLLGLGDAAVAHLVVVVAVLAPCRRTMARGRAARRRRLIFLARRGVAGPLRGREARGRRGARSRRGEQVRVVLIILLDVPPALLRAGAAQLLLGGHGALAVLQGL